MGLWQSLLTSLAYVVREYDNQWLVADHLVGIKRATLYGDVRLMVVPLATYYHFY